MSPRTSSASSELVEPLRYRVEASQHAWDDLAELPSSVRRHIWRALLELADEATEGTRAGRPAGSEESAGGAMWLVLDDATVEYRIDSDVRVIRVATAHLRLH